MRKNYYKLLTINLQGFTLIELLVVISIIAILAVISSVIFTNVQKDANDARRKSDVQAIVKALELKNAKGTYQDISAANFSSGVIPIPPEGGNYFRQLSADNMGFRVCAALEGGTPGCSEPSSTCYCQDSSQGQYISLTPTPTPNLCPQNIWE